MPRRAVALLLFLGFVPLFSSIGARVTARALPFRNPALTLDERVADLLARLTPEEKIRLMVERAGTPLYPFGHGLSYVRFEYSGLQVPADVVAGAPLPVAVTVRNTGAMTADEVVQVYVTREAGPAGAPLRALKAFTRVRVEPGQSRRVNFTLDERALSTVEPDGRRSLGPGRLVIAVGGRQPGRTGGAEQGTTQVVTTVITVTGTRKTLAP